MNEKDGQAGGMRYKHDLGKVSVVIDTAMDFADGSSKRWVEVVFQWMRDNKWIPSFKELFFIIFAICHCEDLKYPDGQGRFMVRDFLKGCCEVLRPDQTAQDRWDELSDKFKLEERQ